MQNNSIIEGIRNYFLDCPFLDDLSKIGVEFLENEPVNYSIDVIPGEEVYKRYVGGDVLRQRDFLFSARMNHGADETTNLQNFTFYEKFSDWVKENNKKGTFPELPGSLVPQYLEVTTGGYVDDIESQTARYCIQMKLIYYQ